MTTNFIARAETTIDVTPDRVWKALVDPKAIHEYMFGTNVTSDFREGSPITWKGEWQGKPYEDKGVVRRVVPGRTLEYTHFSPLAGLPDTAENYHTVRIELAPAGSGTRVTLEQDSNRNENERAHSQQNWEMMLSALRKFLEQ